MGKTPEKLRLEIWVDPEWEYHEKIGELRGKGHAIRSLVSMPHLILSKNAHMWNDKMWPLLEVTMKAARARKKGQASEDE